MKLQVRGVETFATTGGRPFVPEQPTIVFVHGAGMNRIVWYLQTRYFAHHGHAVLAVDLPGHGRSQGTLLGSVQELADWIPDLLDSAGVAKATLVGHSMGSLIALESGARHPDRVSKLALLGAASKMPVHPDLLEAANADDPLAYDLMMDWGTGPVGHFGRHPVPGISLISGGRNLLRMENSGVLGNDLGLCNDYQSGMESATKVSCPTLVVAGEVDRMTPVKQGLKLCGAISGAESQVIAKAGHLMMIEHSGETLATLKGFLQAG
jgi:pimeloyl-ACP methyl ester carboxylesterase|tara:strand:- start:10196 stop:10993 length:798 start_codon:yes stop_codon:yes gene_type:complete